MKNSTEQIVSAYGSTYIYESIIFENYAQTSNINKLANTRIEIDSQRSSKRVKKQTYHLLN